MVRLYHINACILVIMLKRKELTSIQERRHHRLLSSTVECNDII